MIGAILEEESVDAKDGVIDQSVKMSIFSFRCFAVPTFVLSLFFVQPALQLSTLLLTSHTTS